MDFLVDTTSPLTQAHEALIVPLFEDRLSGGYAGAVDQALGGALQRLVAAGDFAAQAKEIAVLYPTGEGRPKRVILVGLGEQGGASLERLRRVAGEASKRARALRAGEVTFAVHEDLLVLGCGSAHKVGRALCDAATLAAYRDETYKTKAEDDRKKRAGPGALAKVTLALAAGSSGAITDGADAASTAGAEQPGAGAHGGAAALERAVTEARALEPAIKTARDLGNLPGNDGGPRVLAERARKVAEACGLRCTILDEERIHQLGMGALLGVARGSSEPPRMILLEHGADRAERPIVLVGKGVTFDTGGISIKPAQAMEEMKFDKCGGTAVIGALEACARLGIERRVVGVIPCAENMLGPAAQRPGDICRAMDGQTIEVVNTDAEGRLLLADALAYACKTYEPACIVDLATLTGACVVALAHVYAGLFSLDDGLAAEIDAAAAATGERTWRLPLDADFDDLIKSPYADVKNSGGRWGGATTAAQFLKKFVPDSVPWAHLDIAGTAWVTDEKPYYAAGATGFGVRLLVEWLQKRISDERQAASS